MAGLLIFARTEGSVLYLARSASEDCRGVGARLLEFTLSTLAVTDTVDLRCWAEHHRLVRWYRRRGAGTPYRCVQATQRWRDGWCYVTYMSAAAAMRNGCSDDDETESDEDEDEEYTVRAGANGAPLMPGRRGRGGGSAAAAAAAEAARAAGGRREWAAAREASREAAMSSAELSLRGGEREGVAQLAAAEAVAEVWRQRKQRRRWRRQKQRWRWRRWEQRRR